MLKIAKNLRTPRWVQKSCLLYKKKCSIKFFFIHLSAKKHWNPTPYQTRWRREIEKSQVGRKSENRRKMEKKNQKDEEEWDIVLNAEIIYLFHVWKRRRLFFDPDDKQIKGKMLWDKKVIKVMGYEKGRCFAMASQ